MLEITEAGRARVASLEFAEELEEFVTNAKEGFVAGSDGLPISEKVGQTVLIVHVAAALSGKEDPDEFKTEAKLEELNRFIQENTPEIDAVIGTCLDMLKARDTEGQPQN